MTCGNEQSGTRHKDKGVRGGGDTAHGLCVHWHHHNAPATATASRYRSHRRLSIRWRDGNVKEARGEGEEAVDHGGESEVGTKLLL